METVSQAPVPIRLYACVSSVRLCEEGATFGQAVPGTACHTTRAGEEGR